MRPAVVMVCAVLCVWLGSTGCAPAPATTEVENGDLKQLAGTWIVTYHEKDGVRLSARDLEDLPWLTFEGDTYQWTNGESGRIVYLDETRTPKALDYVQDDGEHPGERERGIYQLDGDTFMDCFSEAGGARPTEFRAPKGSGRTLVTYRRVK
jgi:uncharacterized protein (TIGR03067 family)